VDCVIRLLCQLCVEVGSGRVGPKVDVFGQGLDWLACIWDQRDSLGCPAGLPLGRICKSIGLDAMLTVLQEVNL